MTHERTDELTLHYPAAQTTVLNGVVTVVANSCHALASSAPIHSFSLNLHHLRQPRPHQRLSTRRAAHGGGSEIRLERLVLYVVTYNHAILPRGNIYFVTIQYPEADQRDLGPVATRVTQAFQPLGCAPTPHTRRVQS